MTNALKRRNVYKQMTLCFKEVCEMNAVLTILSEGVCFFIIIFPVTVVTKFSQDSKGFHLKEC